MDLLTIKIRSHAPTMRVAADLKASIKPAVETVGVPDITGWMTEMEPGLRPQ
jgi:hypothetical protein